MASPPNGEGRPSEGGSPRRKETGATRAPERPLVKPRPRFAIIDPLLINKPLLYKTADDKYCIALVLHAERDPATGRFPVSKAMPSELFKKGVRGPDHHLSGPGVRQNDAPQDGLQSLQSAGFGVAAIYRIVGKDCPCLTLHEADSYMQDRRGDARLAPLSKHNRFHLPLAIDVDFNDLRWRQLVALALSSDRDLADIASADIAKEYPGPQD
jgi:hypothetical protein